MRARDQRGRGRHDQADRERDHQPRVRRGLGRARSRPAFETGRSVAVVGSGPGGARGGAAAAPRRPRASSCSSATRRPAGWCASACRTSRSRSGSSSGASTSSSRRASSCASASTSASTSTRQELRGEFDAVVLAIGSRVPRDLAGAGPRAARHALRDGVPLRAQPLGRDEFGPAPRRAAAAGQPDHAPPASDVVVIGGGDTGADCVGQAVREGAALGRAARARARAAAAPPRRPHAVAALAEQDAALLRDEGGAAAPGRGELDFSVVTTRISGDGRVEALHVAQRAGRRRRSPRSRAPSTRSPPTSCCSRWASCTPSTRASWRSSASELDERGNVDAPALRDLGRGRVRGRRRAPRPVADRLGDQRGPPVRARGRALSRALPSLSSLGPRPQPRGLRARCERGRALHGADPVASPATSSLSCSCPSPQRSLPMRRSALTTSVLSILAGRARCSRRRARRLGAGAANGERADRAHGRDRRRAADDVRATPRSRRCTRGSRATSRPTTS